MFESYHSHTSTAPSYPERFLVWVGWHKDQGCHTVWKSGKTGKMAKTNSLLGKIREFQNLNKNQGIIREFYKK